MPRGSPSGTHRSRVPDVAGCRADAPQARSDFRPHCLVRPWSPHREGAFGLEAFQASDRGMRDGLNDIPAGTNRSNTIHRCIACAGNMCGCINDRLVDRTDIFVLHNLTATRRARGRHDAPTRGAGRRRQITRRFIGRSRCSSILSARRRAREARPLRGEIPRAHVQCCRTKTTLLEPFPRETSARAAERPAGARAASLSMPLDASAMRAAARQGERQRRAGERQAGAGGVAADMRGQRHCELAQSEQAGGDIRDARARRVRPEAAAGAGSGGVPANGLYSLPARGGERVGVRGTHRPRPEPGGA
jgi:hypothetical protein